MRKTDRFFGVVALLLSLAVVVMAREGDETLPEDLRGFSGQVRGVVAAGHDDNSFMFQVARVLKVWENNKAEAPRSLGGRTVRVGPRWTKGDDGEWHPIEGHVAYIGKLRPGQEMTLEIQNVERDHFQILELSREQRARLKGQRHERERDEQIGRERREIRGSGEAEAREREVLIKVLRQEMRELHAENAELRRLLKQSKKAERERRD